MAALAKVRTCKYALTVLMAFLLVALTQGVAAASESGPSAPAASQPSAQCSLPVTSPTRPSNTDNCRSTDPELMLYTANSGDSTGCVFDLTVDWGDGQTTNVPDLQGGTDDLLYVASHTYSDPGVYKTHTTGYVASGTCTWSTDVFQFSYISAGAAYPDGPPLTAKTILSRGADWVANAVPYDQGAYYTGLDGTYREDCSGFVSMAWDLDYSLTTNNLGSSSVSTEVAAGLKAIEPGDIILKAGHHVFLFVEWANRAHTKATVYEETGTSSPTPFTVVKTLSLKNFKGFKVYRYNNKKD